MKSATGKCSVHGKGGMLPLALLLAAAAALPVSAASAVSVPAASPAGQADPAAARLVEGVRYMIAHPETTPEYLGGFHPDWHGNSDHCYSIYFRIAIKQGLLPEERGEAIMKSMKPGDGDSFRQVMFPEGFRRLTYKVEGGTAVFPPDPVPAGYLISMDGSDHNMLSTGRTAATRSSPSRAAALKRPFGEIR
jgi:hypothetical protein